MAGVAPVSGAKVLQDSDPFDTALDVASQTLTLDDFVVGQFADSTDRDAAIPSPSKGQVCTVCASPGAVIYFQGYNGSAWVTTARTPGSWQTLVLVAGFISWGRVPQIRQLDDDLLQLRGGSRFSANLATSATVMTASVAGGGGAAASLIASMAAGYGNDLQMQTAGLGASVAIVPREQVYVNPRPDGALRVTASVASALQYFRLTNMFIEIT